MKLDICLRFTCPDKTEAIWLNWLIVQLVGKLVNMSTSAMMTSSNGGYTSCSQPCILIGQVQLQKKGFGLLYRSLLNHTSATNHCTAVLFVQKLQMINEDCNLAVHVLSQAMQQFTVGVMVSQPRQPRLSHPPPQQQIAALL